MDYYSNQMSKLIEELSCLPGIGAKSAARLAFHLIHMPVDDVKRLASTMVEARENINIAKNVIHLPIRNCARSAVTVTVIIRRSWWLRIQEILRHMKRQGNIMVCIMCFMVQSLRCLG